MKEVSTPEQDSADLLDDFIPKREKPRSIIYAVTIGVILILLDFGGMIIGMVENTAPGIIILYTLILDIWCAVLLAEINSRKMRARLTYSILLSISVLLSLGSLVSSYPLSQKIAVLIEMSAIIVVLVLLWQKASTNWLSKKS